MPAPCTASLDDQPITGRTHHCTLDAGHDTWHRADHHGDTVWWTDPTPGATAHRDQRTQEASRPRKPWRVTLTGPDLRATSDHTSERGAYAFLLAALRGDSPATAAHVDQWEDGRWWMYETVQASDLPPAP